MRGGGAELALTRSPLRSDLVPTPDPTDGLPHVCACGGLPTLTLRGLVDLCRRGAAWIAVQGHSRAG